MDKKNNSWIIQNSEYDLETCLRYISLPISEKLGYLDEVNEFFYNLTPKENRLAWQKLKEEGF